MGDGSFIYVPQKKYWFFWLTLRKSNGYDDWPIECQTREGANEAIKLYKRLSKSYKVVESTEEEIW